MENNGHKELTTVTDDESLPITWNGQAYRPLDDEEDAVDTFGPGTRIPRLACTQSDEDSRMPDYPSGTLFLTRRIYALDEDTGHGAKEVSAKCLNTKVIEEAYLLGTRECRTWFEKDYDPTNPDPKPSCASSDAKRPDPQYVEARVAPCPLCVGRDAQGKKVPVCPMAQWSEKDGKRVPPPCTYAVQAGFAARIDGEWTVFDIYFRRTSETAGRQLMGGAKVLKARNMSLYTYPTAIKSVKSSEGRAGRTIIAIMRDTAADLDPEDFAKLDELTRFWNDVQDSAKATRRSQPMFAEQRPVAELESGEPYPDTGDIPF